MARTTLVVLVDDLDGGEAAEQLQFSIDGVEYEIDLNEANASRLRDLLAPYVGAGRRRGGRSRRTSPTTATRRTPRELSHVRDWARAHGHTVSDRGRIPQSIIDAYAEADRESAS